MYISSENKYRNDEIYDLVWKLNPYVKGISDLPANAGGSKVLNYETSNFIKNIEISHGLSNGYRDYPVIYYEPKNTDNIDKYIFYDTTTISTNPTDSQIKNSFESIFLKYPELTPRRIEFKNIKNRSIKDLAHEPFIINNIYEYCDLLHSCKVFICGFSGSSALASAIKQNNSSPNIYSFGGIGYKGFLFKNANYSDWK